MIGRASTSAFGTFETCRPALKMSVHRGRSEVTGGRSERRDWHFSDLVVWADDRFAPNAVIPDKLTFDTRPVIWPLALNALECRPACVVPSKHRRHGR